MRTCLLLAVLLVTLATSSFAVPVGVAEYGVVPQKDRCVPEDVCYLGYYNFCSEWVYYWAIYCGAAFEHAPSPPISGTCFDLTDCPGACRHLTDVWWACRRSSPRGVVNVEIYCADEHCCPVGTPIVGIYNYSPDTSTPWQHFEFDDLELCPCDLPSGKFIFMITDLAQVWHPTYMYSDRNNANINAGCETEWRCSGHSFVYRNVVSYCDVYGVPGAMWGSSAGGGCTNYPAIPPGCHNYFYNTGFYTEFLIHCYISCQGPTVTEETSWSEVKKLYK